MTQGKARVKSFENWEGQQCQVLQEQSDRSTEGDDWGLEGPGGGQVVTD